MKSKTLALILTSITSIGSLYAAAAQITKTPQVKLAWDAPTDTDIKGYRVYYGTVSGVYSGFVDVETSTIPGVPPTDALIKDLTPRVTYYFAVTAYNTALLESLPSNEISWTAPKIPGKPTNLRVSIVSNAQGESKIQISLEGLTAKRVVSIEASEDLTNWAPIGYTISNDEGEMSFVDENSDKYAQRFYRAKY